MFIRKFSKSLSMLSTAGLMLIVAVSTWAADVSLCQAGIYKYQKDGVWYYTDTPPADMPAGSRKISESDEPGRLVEPSGRVLLSGYPARNALEKATAATVTINSALGMGSGFFITRDGFIVTNKHVIRTSAPESRKVDSYFSKGENRVAEIEADLIREHKRMLDFQDQLENLKQKSEAQNHLGRRNAYKQEYENNLKKLQEWQRSFKERRKTFDDEKERFQSSRSSYDYSRSVADLAQSFTVVLADKTELYARLVAVSTDFDLAMLKVDGYTTPALKPSTAVSLVQGAPVYAIGSPARLHNSVTSGILSGFDQGDIQTNAQIYPGNSGGPLVDEQGRVIGINTYKKLTYKFEGLGFAIPIETALREFAGYLPAQNE